MLAEVCYKQHFFISLAGIDEIVRPHPTSGMKKIISFLFLGFIVNLAAFGQQDPQYTNNMFYKLGVNPGYAGADGAIVTNGKDLWEHQKPWFLVQMQRLMHLELREELV